MATNPQLELEKLHSTIKGALFMQHDRSYVPQWMDIRDIEIGVSLKPVSGKPEATIKIIWFEKRGTLERPDGNRRNPSWETRIWLHEYWKAGLEGLIKLSIKESVTSWEKTVSEEIKLGAKWIPN